MGLVDVQRLAHFGIARILPIPLYHRRLLALWSLAKKPHIVPRSAADSLLVIPRCFATSLGESHRDAGKGAETAGTSCSDEVASGRVYAGLEESKAMVIAAAKRLWNGRDGWEISFSRFRVFMICGIQVFRFSDTGWVNPMCTPL